MTGPPFWQNLTDSTDFQDLKWKSWNYSILINTGWQQYFGLLAKRVESLLLAMPNLQQFFLAATLTASFEKIENRMIVMHCMHDVDVSYFRTSIKYTLSHQGHYKQTAIIFYQNVLLFLNHKTRLDSTQDQIIKYMMIQKVRLGFRFCLR